MTRVANLAARQQLLAAMQAPAAQQVKANSVFTVRFDFGSTRETLDAAYQRVATAGKFTVYRRADA